MNAFTPGQDKAPADVWRVQELFTAESAEGAEHTRVLSGLGGLRGEWLWTPKLLCHRPS